MSAALPPPLAAASSPDSLLAALLEVSLTGVIFFRPLYSADETHIIDLAYEYLNPAAQRLLGRPECPPETFLTLYPNALDTGIFAFYRDTFRAGTAAEYRQAYRFDGLDDYFQLSARRSGAVLVVSFLTAEHQRAGLLDDLSRTQAREQAALAAVEQERNLLQAMLAQAPVAMGLFEGPQQVVRQANALLCAMWSCTPAQVLGRPLLEGVPELRGQGFDELIARVAATGVPFAGREAPALLPRDGQLATHYFNFVYQPLYAPDGALLGVVDIAIDVTEQVEARQRVQILNTELAHANEELAAANEELRAANEEIQVAIADLQLSEQALQHLNNELETRVQQRTQEARMARAAAERERARLERFFRQAPAGICVLDGPELVFELVNPRYQQFFPDRRLRGRPILEAMPELAAHPVYESLRQVYDTGRTREEEAMLIPMARPHDGQLEDRYFDYIQQARRDEQGRIDGVLVFAFEVTEQARIRQLADTLQTEVLNNALQQAQLREEFEQVFEQTPAIIGFLRGPEHRLVYYNPAYQRLFRGRLERHVPLARLQPEAVEAGFIALLDAVYQSGETHYGTEVPLHIEQPDGQPPVLTYFDFTYQAYRENGAVTGISVFAYDVTERALARQQRDAQQHELQRIFEQAPVAIAILRGPALRIELANAAVAAIWGRPAAQVLGRPYFEALPETAGQGFEQILGGVLETGEAFAVTETPVRLPRTGDEPAYVNFLFAPLYDDEPRPTGLVAVGTDVTEQVLARWQVQQLNDELAAANAGLQAANHTLHGTNQQLTRTNVDLDNFIYTASHDLKQPIANIEGLLQALTQQLPTDVLQSEHILPILDMMQGSVDRFRNTIDHLTDVSKLQLEFARPTEPVALATVLENVRLDLHPLLAATQARLEIDVQGCPTVRFSEKNLRSVLYNLLSNALKYRHPDRVPQVRVACQPVADGLVLRVHDNGLGLDERQQGRLFGMFQRLHTHVEGSGIGLYMVRKIVENAGGSITVESQPNVGSTFTVTFPA